MTTYVRELLRGKTFGRSAMNAALSPWMQACHGRWLDVGGGRLPSYVRLLSPACERVATDVQSEDTSQQLNANAPFPYPDASFDGAFALNMLYILEDPRMALGEIRRVVRSGGRLIASFPFFFPEHPEPHDYHRWTREGVERLLREAGYTDVQILPTGGPGTAFGMSLMPFRGSRFVRLCAAPFIFLWDWCARSSTTTCFWIVSCRV